MKINRLKNRGNIIGIIFASMSLGYWYGGKKAEKNIVQYKAVFDKSLKML